MKKHTLAFGTAAAAIAIAGVAALPAGAQTATTSAAVTSVAAPVMISVPVSYVTMASANLFSAGDLTVGSRGEAVAQLQMILSELGYLQMPEGVAPGYFGALTKASVTKLQQELGVSATGYFGPLTRAAMIEAYSAKGWITMTNGLPQWGSAATSTSATSTGSTSTSTAPTRTVSVLEDSIRLPQGSDGYWYNGTWYNFVPGTSTTTADHSAEIVGYWVAGNWRLTNPALLSTATVPANQTTPSTPAPTTSGTSAATSNLGYWYNNVWYPVTSTQGGGYYSTR